MIVIYMERQQSLITWLTSLQIYQNNSLELISGDASFRRYYRFTNTDGETCIAVDAPVDTEKNQEFVAIAKGFAKVGIKAPIVYAVDYQHGFMVLSDGGDVLLSERLSITSAPQQYKQSLDTLILIQSVLDYNDYVLPNYDQGLLDNEFSLFTEWLLDVHLAMDLTSQQQTMLAEIHLLLSQNFVDQPQVCVHRDYHSRNIMLTAADKPFIIDFQDAVLGPCTYDAVSLLRDCYVRWPDELVSNCLQDWHQAHYPQYPWLTFKRWFDLTGIQRHIKAAGIFARLNHRDGKSSYLSDIPNTLQYIVDVAAEYPETCVLSVFVKNEVLSKFKSDAL